MKYTIRQQSGASLNNIFLYRFHTEFLAGTRQRTVPSLRLLKQDRGVGAN
ncbi:MAG: hypothetical protein OEZ58_18055 [Gammaproteobacteria bacterium]|nr:hypothetical protein [Gammaproteobacteria bacterium]MDH5730896.1 hypothetical protein [Gammaproteobacteria bacterium]